MESEAQRDQAKLRIKSDHTRGRGFSGPTRSHTLCPQSPCGTVHFQGQRKRSNERAAQAASKAASWVSF
jgi:hypothetical protein